MQEANAVQIANQLGQIAAQLAAIREALEKIAAQQSHPYIQTKQY